MAPLRHSGQGGAAQRVDKRRASDFQDGDDPSVRAHWAVLVAGSNGWGNYRHQADVYHAYQVLLRGGLLPKRMIVMAYDDIARHEMNPVPGKVFNRPGGPDVYEGVAIDYRGQDVTAETFVAVVKGDARAVAHKGTGRVLESGPHDKVFLFYSDHGAAGVLGMPEGPFLYADQLHSALRHRAQRDGFQEMVLYIEACESGSMFEGLLEDRANIYATTAANAIESSWATYCPSFFAGSSDGAAPAGENGGSPAGAGLGHASVPLRAPAPGGAAGAAWVRGGIPGPLPPPSPPSPEWNTCLGDLYSVAWLEDAESSDMTHETLEGQFHLLRLRASNNFSYVQGSHVMRYGDMDIDAEVAGDYMGMYNNGSAPQPSEKPTAAAGSPADNMLSSVRRGGERGAGGDRPDASTGSGRRRSAAQRDADLLPLLHSASRARCPRRRAAAAAALNAELGRRSGVDGAARGAAAALLADPRAGAGLLPALAAAGMPATGAAEAPQANVGQGERAAAGLPAASRRRLQGLFGAAWERPVEAVVGARLGGGGDDGGRRRPLVQDWDCLRSMVQEWEGSCGAMDQYAMRHTRLFSNLCNAGVAPAALGRALIGAGGCSGNGQLLA